MTEEKESRLIPRIIQKLKNLSSTARNRPSIRPFGWLVNFLKETPSLKPIRLYWNIYGGWKALFRSPYFWLAIIFTIILFPAWNEINDKGSRPWAQLPLQILPNILGFSMGGMAIVLAFTGSSLFKAISQGGRDDSYFIKMIVSFFHFILVQTLAIMLGLLCTTYSNVVFSSMGFFMMIYAIMVAVATATQLFNTARIANIASQFTEAQIDAANSPSIDTTQDARGQHPPS